MPKLLIYEEHMSCKAHILSGRHHVGHCKHNERPKSYTQILKETVRDHGLVSLTQSSQVVLVCWGIASKDHKPLRIIYQVILKISNTNNLGFQKNIIFMIISLNW